MKINIRYQSRNGNTRGVAEVIAQEFDTEALSVEHPVTDYTDILFLGGGVYAGKMDKSLHTFIEQLSADKVGQIIAFSTTGAQSNTLQQIRKAAEKKGIPVNKHELLLKMFLHGHSSFKLTGGNLTEKHLEKIKLFIDEIQEEL